jgi:hypothetical protein
VHNAGEAAQQKNTKRRQPHREGLPVAHELISRDSKVWLLSTSCCENQEREDKKRGRKESHVEALLVDTAHSRLAKIVAVKKAAARGVASATEGDSCEVVGLVGPFAWKSRRKRKWRATIET